MTENLLRRFQFRLLHILNNHRIFKIAKSVKNVGSSAKGENPVVFFNASTRLGGVSQNAAFAFLSSSAVQLAGTPVVHFACNAGMTRCQLGTNPDDAREDPPCRTCVAQSQVLTSNATTHWFTYVRDLSLDSSLKDLKIDELSNFEYPWKKSSDGEVIQIPLGRLTISSLRWTLRIHHLVDDEPTRILFREFIKSAYRVALEFDIFLNDIDARLVVVFNGIAFPEAVARWVAMQHSLRVVTHEIAHQPMTAFFSNEHVTAYRVEIPDTFRLNSAQNSKIDKYLEQRFEGNFTMGGIKFWPEMQELDDGLLEKIREYKQLVPVFPNVIFDTSQIHANKIFIHMFAWLDQVHKIAKDHLETLFVIRAHPDEMRPKSNKQSRETVAEWAKESQITELPNVVFIHPLEYFSSYALIQRAKFVMAYNSTIALEAVLMGKPVLNGGHARYTQYPCVFLPNSPGEHRQIAEDFLTTREIPVPSEFNQIARQFQYYQLYRTPIPFDRYLKPHPIRGYVMVRNFPITALHPENSLPLKVVINGLLDEAPFLMPDILEDQNDSEWDKSDFGNRL